jgi:hypothetical protein
MLPRAAAAVARRRPATARRRRRRVHSHPPLPHPRSARQLAAGSNFSGRRALAERTPLALGRLGRVGVLLFRVPPSERRSERARGPRATKQPSNSNPRGQKRPTNQPTRDCARGSDRIGGFWLATLSSRRASPGGEKYMGLGPGSRS